MNYLTTRQMADRLGVKPATLRQWRYLGCPPGIRLNYSRVVYRESDAKAILAWRQENLLPHGRPPKKEESCLSK